MCSSSPVRTPKIQLAAEQPPTGECWQRRSPSKKVGGAKSHLESHLYPPEMLRELKQIMSLSLAYEITQLIKINHAKFHGSTCPLQWPTLYLWRVLLSESE